MEVYDWINNSKQFHLKLEDIEGWDIGETADVVIFDTNFEEYHIWKNLEPNKHYNPEEFFKENRCTLTYKGNMIWDITFSFGKTIEHPIHLDMSHLPTKWKWVGVTKKDGYIDISNEMFNKSKVTSYDRSIHIHWTMFSKATRIGWRGPIMFWSKTKEFPGVYYKS